MIFSNSDVGDARRLLGLIAGVDNSVGIEGSRASEVNRDSLIGQASKDFSNRRKRNQVFGIEMFGEVGWDLLLALYVEQAGQRLNASRLAERVGAAMATVLRWLKYLESRDWIARKEHPNDGRILFVELTDKGRNILNVYFSELLTKDK